MSDAEKLQMIRSLAEAALELTKGSDTYVKEFWLPRKEIWLLRNQMRDILRIVEEQ